MVSKVIYTDITNKQTNGESGAALVNDTKRAINEVIDLVGDIDLGGVGGSTLPVFQPRQLGDGVKTTFNTPATGSQGAKAQHFDVYLNYVYQRPELDFSIGGATGDLTFLDNVLPYAPNLNDTIDIKYVKPYTFDTSSDTPVEGTGTGVTKSIGDWFGEAGPAKVTATGTTTPRSLADRFGSYITPEDFGATGDGVALDTAELAACHAYAKENKIPIQYAGKDYKIDAPIDPTGVEFTGVPQGYNNRLGTRIICSGNSAFVQPNNSSESLQFRMKNFQIINADWGLEIGYSLGTVIESVSVNDSTNGFKLGAIGASGPLSCELFKCRADVTDVALEVSGGSFANANKFDTCFFRGDTECANISVDGGLGGINNLFINTEIAGENNGIRLGQTKGTAFYNCYFECHGPNIIIDGFSIGTSLDNCTFGTLDNNNTEGVPSFIWHKSGSAEITLNGGYIYLPDNLENENLSMIHSDIPTSLTFNMPVRPSREIAASGWSLYGTGMPNGKGEQVFSGDYDPTWTSLGSAPSIGDGTITGRYTQTGESITATIELNIGSTTGVGTNTWLFGLPFDASPNDRYVGSALIRESGVGFYPAVCVVNGGSDKVTLYATSAGGAVSNVDPIIWSDGDRVNITITYNI